VFISSRAPPGDIISGSVVQYCYFDLSNVGVNFNSGTAFFNGACQDSPSTQPNPSPSAFHHNVVKGGFSMFNSMTTGSGPNSWPRPVAVYNNTWDMGSGGMISGCSLAEASGFTGLFSVYNNLFYDDASGNFSGLIGGYVASNVDGFAVLNYNIYGTKSGAFSTFAANGGASSGALISFSAWKTAVGKDANSTTNSANPFTSAGALALAYTTPSGIASGFGRVGGLSTGAAVNAGAWDGTSAVIGCNFAL
jgi:hypothetical protein